MYYSLDDTIAAISTPVGEGGIGIVRMTGPNATGILDQLFLPSSRGPNRSWEARRLHYGHIADPDTGELVDEVLAAYMPAPRTYTRQDIVEINGHGGIVALRRILGLCLRQGARLAEAGEFTARAFLNGRLDLAQAEAVLDVVRAKTEVSLRAAVGQLTGRLSDQVRVVRATLLDALAYLEASIDFEEDEIPERDIGPDLAQARAVLSQLLADADRGIIYRQGIRVAIVGRPNVGKSSLLNQLLRTSRAIVTDIPGTTRDTLEETLNLQGVPVVLVDTAGIIEKTEDPIERLGIERSRTALAQSDLALLVVDVSQPVGDGDRAIAALIESRPAILVLNKTDLPQASCYEPCPLLDAPAVPVSALTGEGLDALEETIVETVFSGQVTTSEVPMVTSPRHKEALNRALEHVQVAYDAHQASQLLDLIAIDLTAAVNTLGEITGQTAGDDLVETVFGNFCVGK
jgi:tRNA modification GTPase